MNANNPKALGYVVITDYVEANTGKDVSDAIQKVINENPMKTIYFPDGEYILAKPICTSARPATSVSIACGWSPEGSYSLITLNSAI